jgi:methylmalonyl-CoA epimerase
MTPSTPRGTRVSHVGIAVEALSETLPFFRDVLGLREIPLDDADGASIVGLRAGEPLVELLEAENEESPIARFIAKRGPGIHHICFSVDAVEERGFSSSTKNRGSEPKEKELRSYIRSRPAVCWSS